MLFNNTVSLNFNTTHLQRLRTPEEKEDDRRIIDCLVDCKVLIKEVMLPVVLADLHYLLSVYVDCRKQNWSSVLI